MISSLLRFIVIGFLGIVVLGLGLTVVGMAVGLATFLLFKVAPLVLIGYFASQAGGSLGSLFESLSVASRFDSMGRGVIDLRDLVYFVTFTAFFLYLDAQAVENRRVR